MISLDLRIFENGAAGLQVKVVARGAAKSPLEQIYFAAIQPAVQQALIDAGAEAERQGLSAPLSEEFKAAATGQAPAPLSAAAVEIPFAPAGVLPVQFVPRPPSFPEFIQGVVEETRRIGSLHKACEPHPVKLGGCERSCLVDAIAAMLVQRGQGFLDRQLAFIAYMKRQATNQGGN